MKIFPATILAALLSTAPAWAGPYTDPGIAADDPSIVAWGTVVVNYSLGPMNISDPGAGNASFGSPENTLGPADSTPDDPFNVLSLGDGGYVTLGFATPITNGTGADFAVFENSLEVDGLPGMFFLELAFVEVSSNGSDFFRFPSISLTPTDSQLGAFAYMDPTNVHNLAGKHLAGYGTGFDLSDLIGVSPLLDVNAITHVRIRDVVGSVNPAYASYDSLGNIINDPWFTSFPIGGFDLDAIGVIHQVPEPRESLLLLAGGLLAAAAYWKKRQRQSPLDRT